MPTYKSTATAVDVVRHTSKASTMISFTSLIVSLLAASTTALPTELSRRAVIAHDAVVGFPQTVPSGTVGTLMLKYKPWLKVFNGCVPFPAVDAAGNTGCVFVLFPRLFTIHHTY